MIEYSSFSSLCFDPMSKAFLIFPKVFGDSRGSFSEVLKNNNSSEIPDYCRDLTWIKQINRSKSSKLTVRGCHAQKGKFCQAKLVEAINEPIYDIITDMRPEAITFGLTQAYLLDPKLLNKLFVPRGFLHSFVVPKNIKSDEAIFQYYCDNVYDKDSEFGINPLTLLPDFIKNIKSDDKMTELVDAFSDINDICISDKDKNNISFDEFKMIVQNDYVKNSISWWR